MPKKRIDDLLAQVGDNTVSDYIRGRLRKRVELERGITMRRREIETLLRCLDKAATLDRIKELHDKMRAEITTDAWGLEIERRLEEMHGAWRYEGRPDVKESDMERAAKHYATSTAMDALLTECGFPMVRTEEERLDDAAWYAVPSHERG